MNTPLMERERRRLRRENDCLREVAQFPRQGEAHFPRQPELYNSSLTVLYSRHVWAEIPRKIVQQTDRSYNIYCGLWHDSQGKEQHISQGIQKVIV